MLANGATLGYKLAAGATSYTILDGLKEIPEIGIEPEMVDNTTLTDSHKKYEAGIGDLPNMTYKFKYDNISNTSAYRLLKACEAAGSAYDFEETLADGTKIRYSAQVTVKLGGGGVNAAVEFEVTMYVQSDLTITDPA